MGENGEVCAISGYSVLFCSMYGLHVEKALLWISTGNITAEYVHVKLWLWWNVSFCLKNMISKNMKCYKSVSTTWVRFISLVYCSHFISSLPELGLLLPSPLLSIFFFHSTYLFHHASRSLPQHLPRKVYRYWKHLVPVIWLNGENRSNTNESHVTLIAINCVNIQQKYDKNAGMGVQQLSFLHIGRLQQARSSNFFMKLLSYISWPILLNFFRF